MLELRFQLEALLRHHHESADLIRLRLDSFNVLHALFGRVVFAFTSCAVRDYQLLRLLVQRIKIFSICFSLVKVFKLICQRLRHVRHLSIVLDLEKIFYLFSLIDKL